MRKSDKKENFKRVNLIVENRFLESKGIIKESYHDEYKKYDKIMYIGEPKTFYNGKTVKYGDIGEYIGTEGGEEAWVAFPASGFATVFRNFKKVALNEYENGLTTKDELIRIIDGKLEEIKNGKDPKEVGIGVFLSQLKQEDTRLFDQMIEKYKDIVRLSEGAGVVTDLQYITFYYEGTSYRPSKIINQEQSSNGLTIKFGLERYTKENTWEQIGGMLTYYLDTENGTDKLLFTDGRFMKTIDAKTMIDSKYGLYEKIKQYVDTKI